MEITLSTVIWGIFLASLVIGLLFFIYKSINFVPESMLYTVERLGKYNRTLQPGLKFILPLVDKVSERIDVRLKVLVIPHHVVITKDNAKITVDGVVFYRIFDAKKATYEVGDLDEAIEHFIIGNIRTVMGSMTLDDSLSKRKEINNRLFEVVELATDPWGVTIEHIEIKDIAPPEDLLEAMAKQMKAERGKRAAISDAEGKKRALILEAESEKQAAILKAEGYKEAKILKAQGRKEAELLNAETRKEVAVYDAYAREQIAAAEAKATTMVSEAIKTGDIQAINYFIAQDYVKALQGIASADNQKLIMMPLETSNFISSISGIGDIAKEVLGQKLT